MTAKGADAVWYALSNAVSTAGVFALSIVHNWLNGASPLGPDCLGAVAFCFFAHIMLSVFLIVFLCAGRYFHYEIFTYVLLIVGLVFLIFIKDIRSDVSLATMGFPFATVGIFSRVRLWKYDAPQA